MSEEDLDFEEWDGNSPFWIHCVAGSLAGVVEHTAVYPLDTVRTHIQVCAACMKPQAVASNTNNTKVGSSLAKGAVRGSRTLAKQQPNLPMGMWQTIRHLVQEPAVLSATAAVPSNQSPPLGSSTASSVPMMPNYGRLWRGVQTILIGCIPAHALYFSSYEIVKASTLDSNGHVTTYGSSLAGAAATFSHDLILTPLDTIKQRMQLGHYQNVSSALHQISLSEGYMALYRSLPITLITNIPYGMIMVTVHEKSKEFFAAPDRPVYQTVLAASSLAGFVAAAATTPLDVLKTRLQTQNLKPTCIGKTDCIKKPLTLPQAIRSVYQNEGIAGFFRGMQPRVLAHTPAVAISWTTYEVTKDFFMRQYAS